MAGAEALRALLDGGEAVPRHYQTIMDREQDADNITREVLIAVRRTFITPFDRGDIKDLITSMDNAIDQMQKTAKAVMLFEQREFTPCMREMGDAIVTLRRAGARGDAAAASRSTPRRRGSTTITEEISALEGKADELHDAGLRELFLRQRDRLRWRFITGNEVYDHLEKVVDRFDDVANRIQRHRDRARLSATTDGRRRSRLPLLIALIAVALLFDFLNGLHDAANSIATIVSTRVLRPQYAVAWAAFFNFIAFLFFGLHVAKTIGTGIVSADDRRRRGDLRRADRARSRGT